MKILIATGGSDYSFMAVKKACEMVIRPESSEIRIISVYRDIANMSAEPLEIAPEQIEEMTNRERVESTEYALKAEEIIRDHFPASELNISLTAVKGQVKRMILEEASKWGADLIVVGSLGHNFLSRLFIGSVSEAIARNATCSVLIVRGSVDSAG